MPYYLKFIEAFPTVHDLAEASEDEVLRLWQGLGYYSRARNLHACAKEVAHNMDGKFPDTMRELVKLKGVGPYTAAAIASICYHEAVPVIDGNVYRFMSRVFDVDVDIASSGAHRFFFDLVLPMIPSDAPGDFNQAMMEFGATYCTPTNPGCSRCDFQDLCEARKANTVFDRPVKIKKNKVRDRFFHYFIFKYDNQVLINRREKDIWKGLYDFYLIEAKQADEDISSVLDALGLANDLPELALEGQSPYFKHILSHQRLAVRFYEVEIKNEPTFVALSGQLDMQIVRWQELEKFGKPILIENYLKNRSLSLL